MTEYYLTGDQVLEVSILEVLHEIESATNFYIYKKVQEKMNVSENAVYCAIDNLHRRLFILSNEDITNNVTTITGNFEKKYYLNPEKWSKK